MKKIIFLGFIISIISCGQHSKVKFCFTLFKTEIKNYKEIRAITKPPIVFFHVELTNFSKDILVLDCINRVYLKKGSKVLLDDLKISPSQNYTLPNTKDTLVIYSELRSQTLTERKILELDEGELKIELKRNGCQNYGDFIPAFEKDKLKEELTLMKGFCLVKSSEYSFAIE